MSVGRWFFLFQGGSLDEIPPDLADQEGAPGIERGEFRIDIEIAVRAGGEGEAAPADRFRSEGLQQ